MAIIFVPEDGTGLANATAYGAIAAADAHFENTGRKTAWTAFSAGERQGAMNAAAIYMDQQFGNRYLGDVQESTLETQALLWPRENVPNSRDCSLFLPVAPLPADLIIANAEFALAYLQGGGQLYAGNETDARSIKRQKVRVEGAVEKDTEFDGPSSANRIRKYPLAEAALARLITRPSRLLLRA